MSRGAHLRCDDFPGLTAGTRDWPSGNGRPEPEGSKRPKGPGRGERGVSITFRRKVYG